MQFNILSHSVLSKARFAVLLLLAASCSMIYFYREIHELEGMHWMKADAQQFVVEVEEPKKLDGRLIIRYIEGFQYKDLTVHVHVNHNGETWSDEFIAIPIRDENGDYLGAGSVDLWDIEHPLFNAKTLSKGSYTFTVEHTMQKDQLPLVMEVGLVLEEV